MQRSDILLLIATFTLGFAAGIYIYFVLYVPNFRFSFTANSTPEASYSITGDEYGACETSTNGCSSFRVLSNRDYRSIHADDSGTIMHSREGLLPSGLLEAFHRELNRTYQRDSLRFYPMQRPACKQDGGGVLFTIDIVDVGRYYLDSCSQQVPADDALYQSLLPIAAYFQR